MGYEVEQLNVTDDDFTYQVLLQEESRQVDEVVVVGYGTQKRTQLTGSVTTVHSEVFANSVSPTLDVALGGQVAGLNVTAASGQPGAASSIRIRGGNSVNASNEPLYVVDGFIYFRSADDNGTGLGAIESSLNPLATINPNDIQSIEVLKDVSAMTIGAAGVKVYRNLANARIVNASLTAQYDITQSLSLRSKLSYGLGRDDDGDPLPLIAPMEYSTTLAYVRSHFKAQLTALGAAKQVNYAPKYAESQTPAYHIINLNTEYTKALGKHSITLIVGIENLLDRNYSTYSDWNNIPQKGRNLYANVNWTW